MDNILEEIVEETTEEIIEEAPVEETKILYNVILDENGYYTGMSCFANYSRFKDGVDVESLPEESDELRVRSYKLDNGSWVFDEDRYKELVNAPSEESEKEPTLYEEVSNVKEQVAMLTECILELSASIYE